MTLLNLTQVFLDDKTNFKLQKGNVGGTKIIRTPLPDDIVIPDDHSIIAYDDAVYITFSGISTAAKVIGKSKQAISEVALGRRPTVYGYFWKYLK